MADTTKRIVFSNETANDQGGIIPNSCMDFSRYNANPVILAEHNWGGYCDKPFDNILGLATDIKLINGDWTMVPSFHAMTETSQTAKSLYEGGYLRACSVGGEAIWKKINNNLGKEEFFYNKDGLRVCEAFYVYEISMVALPSNPDAVQLAAIQESQPTVKVFNTEEFESYNTNITKLSSQLTQVKTNLNTSKMIPEEIAAQKAELETKLATAETQLAEANTALKSAKDDASKKAEAESALETATAEVEQLKSELTALKANKTEKVSLKTKILMVLGLPKVISDVLAADDYKDNLDPDGDAGKANLPLPNAIPQATPTGLKSKLEKAKEKVDAAKAEAEKACHEAEDAKTKFESSEEAEKADAEKSFKEAQVTAEKAVKEAEDAEKAYNKVKAEVDDSEDTEAKAAKKEAEDAEEAEKSKNAAPKRKSIEELKAIGIKLAAKPQIRMTMNKFKGKSFSQLRSEMKSNPDAFEKTEEGKSMGRLFSRQKDEELNPSDCVFLLESILADENLNAKRFDPMGNKMPSIIDNIRFHTNMSMDQFASYRKSASNSVMGGFNIQQLAEKFRSGAVKTFLTSGTDSLLQNPDTLAVEFLPLAIFSLFPDNSWKSDIPLFGIASTQANSGIIWTNVASQPTIYKGTKPSTPSDYDVDDTGVALKLKGYWLQPMFFSPLTMAQLRYDKMATNWSQAFMKLDAEIDDDLLYILASTVPAASMVETSGGGFSIPTTADINAFYSTWFATAPAGSLSKPVLNDLIRMEQLYRKQNFNLGIDKPVAVLGTTAMSLLATDPTVQNKLTEWKTIGEGEFEKFRNTMMFNRSRVAIWDPNSSLIIDPSGSIPSTSIEANVSFIPSQVGIGMGLLDVFFIQDPTNYGYRMSADLRKGIVPLRANYNGTGLLNYGTPSI
jgi:hypothetical protein